MKVEEILIIIIAFVIGFVLGGVFFQFTIWGAVASYWWPAAREFAGLSLYGTGFCYRAKLGIWISHMTNDLPFY